MKPFPKGFIQGDAVVGIKVCAILLSSLAIYFQDLAIVANDGLRSELTSHVIVIPFLVTYLLYRKRNMLKAVIPFETSTRKRETIFAREAIGALLCLLAFLLYWRGSYTFYPVEYHTASLPLFISGLTLLMFNTETMKALAFPIAFLLFLTPPPSEIVYIVGATLSTVSAGTSYKILETIGLPVSLVDYGAPVIILNLPQSSTPFAIDIACSGIYSLMGFSVFVTFLAYITRGPAWNRAIPILAGLPLAYGLNILRIVIVVLIGYWQGVEAALKAFHIFGGWLLIFLGTLLLLTLSQKFFKIQISGTKTSPESCTHAEGYLTDEGFCVACGKLSKPAVMKISRRDAFKIVSLAVCIGLTTVIQVPVFALAQGPAGAITYRPAGMEVSMQIFPAVPGYEFQFVYRDRGYENITKQDASLIYVYAPTNSTDGRNVFVALKVADSPSKLHPWEASLLTEKVIARGQPPKTTTLDLRDVQLSENPPVIGRFFAFQWAKTNQTQVILYWREKVAFKTDLGLQEKYTETSLVVYARNRDEFREIEDILLPFAEAIMNHWHNIKTWSSVALVVAQHGYIPLTMLVLVLPAAMVVHIGKTYRQKRSNLKAFNRLALEEEKTILKAVHQAGKEGRPTGNAIAASYQKLAGKPVSLNTLREKLGEAEEAGLVKRDVANREDEPILVWKNQIPLPKP